jgi:wobble nucleotide-excising tRNase
MRWDYDQFINLLNTDRAASKSKTDSLDAFVRDYDTRISELSVIISEQQKQTVNIEEAITNINNGLIDLGITDFQVNNHSENLYKIVRGDSGDKVFRSLSEGEKMIISFLYFIESCKGKKEATETGKKKIIVIDDPISSLSHIYVFNVGRLIKNEFFAKKESEAGIETWKYKYEQVFILTHSLYFFMKLRKQNTITEKKHKSLFGLQKTKMAVRLFL